MKSSFISRNAFFLGMVSLLNDAAGGIVVSILPLFLISIGVSAGGIGLIEGFAEGFSNIAKGFTGFLEDKSQKKKLIAFFGYTLSASTRILYIIATSFSFVFGVRLLDRVGKAIREPARDALLAYSSENSNVGKSFGLQRAMDTVGGIIGPLVATVILIKSSQNYTLLFIVAFLFGLVALFNFLFITEDRRKIHSDKSPAARSARFKGFLLFSFIFSLGNLPIVLLLLRIRELGGAAFLVPLLFLSYNVFYALFLFFAGVLGDRFRNSRVIFGGILIGVLSLLLFALSQNIMSLWLSFALYGIFSGFTDTGMKSYVARHVATDKFASSYGLFSSITGVGVMMAGALGGAIWQNISPFFALLFASGMLLLSAIMFIWVRVRYA